jgi:hypothetical protein
MADKLKHFDLLCKHGMQVIPLLTGAKKPIQDGWQLGYDQAQCRAYFERNPSMNMGLRLGNIVDVEGDSPHANALVNDLIGDYPHPSYTSRKSIHHLFLTPDPKLARIVFQDVEFRGHKHQSVLPPSVVGEIQYKWKTVVFPIPPMPDRLLGFFKKVQRKRVDKNHIKPGHMKLPCFTCRKDQFLHRKRFQEELAVFKSFGQPWQCQKCRAIDVRPMARKFRGSHLLEAG